VQREFELHDDSGTGSSAAAARPASTSPTTRSPLPRDAEQHRELLARIPAGHGDQRVACFRGHVLRQRDELREGYVGVGRGSRHRPRQRRGAEVLPVAGLA